MPARTTWLVAFWAACLSVDLAQAAEPAYPLDQIERVLAPGAPLPCKGIELVGYRGRSMRLSKPARVHPAFVSKLEALEQLVSELAIAHYGRAPRTLVHLGTHNCRKMRRYPDWVSEHALGNAIDVAGFDFGPMAKNAALPESAPRALRRAFSVRLDKHWNGAHGASFLHSRFLRALAQALIEREDLFRVVLGPAWPGHHNHFHLDYAPYRVVEVF